MMRNPFLILSVFVIPLHICAGTSDSLLPAPKKNYIGIELSGNNYHSPFERLLYSHLGISHISLNYSRLIIRPNSCWQISAGIGRFNSFYINEAGKGVRSRFNLSVPAGFLWRPGYKRNGFWFGLFFTSAFGKQQYLISGYPYIRRTINYDYQVQPNICYRFRSKNEDCYFNIFLSPKFSSAIFAKNKVGYGWKIAPVWGGITVGVGTFPKLKHRQNVNIAGGEYSVVRFQADSRLIGSDEITILRDASYAIGLFCFRENSFISFHHSLAYNPTSWRVMQYPDFHYQHGLTSPDHLFTQKLTRTHFLDFSSFIIFSGKNEQRRVKAYCGVGLDLKGSISARTETTSTTRWFHNDSLGHQVNDSIVTTAPIKTTAGFKGVKLGPGVEAGLVVRTFAGLYFTCNVRLVYNTPLLNDYLFSLGFGAHYRLGSVEPDTKTPQ
jgi:hypothetical protein